VLVSDLRHFLGMPEDAPGPAQRMAEHLSSVVRAATARPTSSAWVSALPCRRRPGHRPCPGHIAVSRPDVPARIEWGCTSCGDEGVISGWEGSPYDLRRSGSEEARRADLQVLVPDEVAATLRGLDILDTDCERLVFRARATSEGIVLDTNAEDLDELIGYVAANANHEENRARQKRMDVAFDVLSDTLKELPEV
jgi:hypothetical protein